MSIALSPEAVLVACHPSEQPPRNDVERTLRHLARPVEWWCERTYEDDRDEPAPPFEERAAIASALRAASRLTSPATVNIDGD